MKSCFHYETIVCFARSGKSGAIIARRPETPLWTVQKIIKRFKDKENSIAKPESGCPRSVSTRRVCQLTKKGLTTMMKPIWKRWHKVSKPFVHSLSLSSKGSWDFYVIVSLRKNVWLMRTRWSSSRNTRVYWRFFECTTSKTYYEQLRRFSFGEVAQNFQHNRELIRLMNR